MNRSENKLCISVRKALHGVSGPVGIAFSGGLDSTVLLDIAAQSLAPERLRAIHVCHNLRSQQELEMELELVRNFCAAKGIPLSVVTIARGTIEAFARREKCGIEAAARIFRYRAFKRVAIATGLSAILLAHHQDDQLETMLMRLVRGGSFGSLEGIRPIRNISIDPQISIIRPFLGIPRSDIMQYAQDAHLRWSEDSTNSDAVYLRNKVRTTLVPILDSHFPFWRSALLNYQTQLGDLRDMLRVHARKKLVELERHVDGRPALDGTRLREEPSALRIEIMKLYTSRFAEARRMRNRGLRHLEAAFIRGSPTIEASGNIFELENNLLVFKGAARYSSSPQWRIMSALDTAYREHVFYLKVETMGEFDCGPFNVRVSRESPRAPVKSADIELQGRAYAIPLRIPFVIRNTRPGDTIETIHGPCAIESIIKRTKLRPPLRDTVPIIEDEHGIAAVLPTAVGRGEGVRDSLRAPSLGEGVQIVYIFLSMKGDQSINV